MNRTVILTSGLLLSLLYVSAATAQQVPVTGRMLGPGPHTAAPATPPAPPAAALQPAPRSVLEDSAATQIADTRALPMPASVPATMARAEPGDTTRQLLRLQASGAHAGRSLPVLGDQAHASYTRYLKSFEHELPEYFENTVGKTRSGGGN